MAGHDGDLFPEAKVLGRWVTPKDRSFARITAAVLGLPCRTRFVAFHTLLFHTSADWWRYDMGTSAVGGDAPSEGHVCHLFPSGMCAIYASVRCPGAKKYILPFVLANFLCTSLKQDFEAALLGPVRQHLTTWQGANSTSPI